MYVILHMLVLFSVAVATHTHTHTIQNTVHLETLGLKKFLGLGRGVL